MDEVSKDEKEGQVALPRKQGKSIFIMVIALVLILGGGFFYTNKLIGPVTDKTPAPVKVVNIKNGSSTRSIAKTLKAQGLIKNELFFRLYARFKGLENKFRAGEYGLRPNMSLDEIFAVLTSNKVQTYTFTVPEGYNIRQIADLLNERGFIDRQKFMELVARGNFNYPFLQGLPQSPYRLEGYLFPDTYKITRGTTEKQIIDMMLKNFVKMTGPEFEQKARSVGLSLHEAVTLASIIEREAREDKERPLISAVFHNRLKKNMKLESCATIQYALGYQKERILQKDLQIESPYNTYKYFGLPPGPIASPGKPSLEAAVNPADVDYLYFVVFENGEHAFSRTLAEHNKNRERYLERFKTP